MGCSHKLTNCVIGIALFGLTLGSSSGLYDCYLYEIATCDDEGTGQIHFGTKITKLARGKYVYNSNFTFGVPWDNYLKMYADYQTWGNGGYRPRSITHTMNNCEEVWKLGGEFLKELMKSAGVEVTKCPVPAGNYTATKLEAKFFINIPIMTYNKYRLILNCFYKEVKVGCVILYGETVPKQ